MTVEDKTVRVGGCLSDDDSKIPVGLRVLAVDDDPICLMVLENLLRKCQYQVTTTNQAITALKLLRENKNKYDLVISDVNMPDMDGFKLLEHVGIEMDIPVIMLSAHSDKELVFKGISHGAVDYLLKPVRIEELKNIWQHVVRKRKFQPKLQNQSPNEDNPSQEKSEEVGIGETQTSSGGQCVKMNRKRKDQDEDEEEAGEENGNETDEPGNQKKPRVVWSVELHRKFVAAVNQLGFDKAVPKKILDLMNEEGLTRENVASHLQKYRLYLKKFSSVASQQANMATVFGVRDPSTYLRMGSLDDFGDFRTLNGPGRLSSTSISSYSSGGMFGRLNSASGLTLRGIAPSNFLQQSTLGNSAINMEKLQPSLLQPNQAGQGILSQLEPHYSSTRYGQFNCNDQTTAFGVSGTANNAFSVQANTQQTQNPGAFGAQSHLGGTSMSNQHSFNGSVRGSSNLLDHSSRYDESWQGTVQLSKLPSDPLPDSLRDCVASTSAQVRTDFTSSVAFASQLEDPRVDLQRQAGLIGNVVQNIDHTSKERWEDQPQNYNLNFSNSFGAIDSFVASDGGAPLQESLDDLMDAMIRREPNEGAFMDGEFGFDAYSLGSCI